MANISIGKTVRFFTAFRMTEGLYGLFRRSLRSRRKKLQSASSPD